MTDTFEDILSELGQGKPLYVQDEERAKLEETPEDGDNPVEQPESDVQDDTDAPEEGDEEKAEGHPDEDPEADDDEPEADAEGEEPPEEPEEKPVTFEIEGEQVTLEDILEWKRGGLRQEDYSRKTMEAANIRKDAMSKVEKISKLAQDIAEDRGLQQFISAHPEALGHLFADPDEARKLLGQPKAVEEFWKDYEIIKDNPRIASKYIKNPDEATAEIRIEQERQVMGNIVTVIDSVVDEMAQSFPDVQPDSVKEFVVSLAGLPEAPDHDQQVEGMKRIFGIFFKQKPDGEWEFKPELIANEFERQSLKVKKPPKKPESDVDVHNKNVDDQLKDQKKPPKTPGGRAPEAEPEVPDIPDTFHEIMQKLAGG